LVLKGMTMLEPSGEGVVGEHRDDLLAFVRRRRLRYCPTRWAISEL
jgi:hypothetical protein